MTAVKVDLLVTDPPENETAARKIEKGRSWKQISSAIDSTDGPLAEDYSAELDLFEGGDIDKHLWAKCLVQADGDAAKAKWQYIKDRVAGAAAKRAEAQRREQEQKRAELDAEKRRIEEAAAEKKKQTAESLRAESPRAKKEAAKKIEAQKKQEEEDLTFVVIFTFCALLIAIAIFFIAIAAQ